MSQQHFSPKDFFLWFGAMVSLYVSAAALLTLSFHYVDLLFPDALERYSYVDPYSGSVRFAMATLFIVFPLFVYLMRRVHEDARFDSAKRELPIRKWLVYLTLFVAGCALAGDLVTLVYYFLNGEITIRFILKVAIVLVVAGGAFLYYLSEVQGRWERDERLSRNIGIVVSGCVAALIVAGFFIAGSPQDARAVRLDNQRITDLQMIQSQLISYWQDNEDVPASLDDLRGRYDFEVHTDPETNEPYIYNRLTDNSFELCAVFKQAAQPAEYNQPVMFGVSENWQHDEGKYCYTRTIDPALYPSNKGETQSQDFLEKPVAPPVPAQRVMETE